MEPKNDHNIYGPERHGRRERPTNEPVNDERELPFEGHIDSAVNVENAIRDGIVEAQSGEKLIDRATARSVARALSDAMGEGAPALNRFARSGEGGRIDLESEYVEMYADERTPEVVRSWINWLASYLFHRDFPRVALTAPLPNDASELSKKLVPDSADIGGSLIRHSHPASQSAIERTRMIARLEPLLVEAGDAMRAYLQLPDVDASRNDLVDRFKVDFAGAFKDVTSAIDAVTELPGWERELVTWAAERGLDGMVAIDRTKVESFAREVWDIVEFGGRCYVFDK